MSFQPEMRVTYTVESADPALFGRGLPVGIITDALTGRHTAVYRDGFRIVLDEPLGECDCVDCSSDAAEAAHERMLDGEPPLSADERHQIAWKQKQELRR
jgi:hypothetical protein